MFAIIETGGKQYRVQEGDIIDVELTSADAEAGADVEFDRVLMVGEDADVKVGTPTIEGASVKGSLMAAVRGPKIKVFKKKRRKGYRRTIGHRQDLHRVRIGAISG
ncbi:MAG: 50S ribosomal protein L21 [Acidobacteriota bacterium]